MTSLVTVIVLAAVISAAVLLLACIEAGIRNQTSKSSTASTPLFTAILTPWDAK